VWEKTSPLVDPAAVRAQAAKSRSSFQPATRHCEMSAGPSKAQTHLRRRHPDSASRIRFLFDIAADCFQFKVGQPPPSTTPFERLTSNRCAPPPSIPPQRLPRAASGRWATEKLRRSIIWRGARSGTAKPNPMPRLASGRSNEGSGCGSPRSPSTENRLASNVAEHPQGEAGTSDPVSSPRRHPSGGEAPRNRAVKVQIAFPPPTRGVTANQTPRQTVVRAAIPYRDPDRVAGCLNCVTPPFQNGGPG
jgi:hypothetical protein